MKKMTIFVQLRIAQLICVLSKIACGLGFVALFAVIIVVARLVINDAHAGYLDIPEQTRLSMLISMCVANALVLMGLWFVERTNKTIVTAKRALAIA